MEKIVLINHLQVNFKLYYLGQMSYKIRLPVDYGYISQQLLINFNLDLMV